MILFSIAAILAFALLMLFGYIVIVNFCHHINANSNYRYGCILGFNYYFAYITSNNILDLVLSKIKTANNDDLILLLDIIQKYADKQINIIDLYVSNVRFSRNCDCFDYFVKRMLNHQFKLYAINTVFRSINNELNKRSCEASCSGSCS